MIRASFVMRNRVGLHFISIVKIEPFAREGGKNGRKREKILLLFIRSTRNIIEP